MIALAPAELEFVEAWVKGDAGARWESAWPSWPSALY
jgi:hypothetical protein